MLDNTQGVEVMVEPETMFLKRFVERALSRVAEGRVSDIMNDCKRFGKIFVQAQGTRDGARYLRNLHGVRKAAAEMVGVTMSEDLGFTGQAAKRAGVKDARTVAFKRQAIRVSRFRIFALGERAGWGNGARWRQAHQRP
jgi:hypothetical protein